MYKWIIVGGGVQGCTAAIHLLRQKKVKQQELLIIDPHDSPMKRWRTLTERVGMDYLRSPSVHHQNPDPHSLRKFSKTNDYAHAFIGRYERPRLDLFNEHCDHDFNELRLLDSWLSASVVGLQKRVQGWRIDTQEGKTLEAECVLLAVGVNESPHYPKWAYSEEERIQHIFSEEINHTDGPLAIVGGGISAAHLAHTYARQNDTPVTLIKRHPFRIHDFDSDPGWLGPKYLNQYHQVSCYEERRELIRKARHRGSITSGLYTKLKQLTREGSLRIVTDEIIESSVKKDFIELGLKQKGSVQAGMVMLATGSENRLPAKEWLADTIKKYQLPCAPCGFPTISSSLEWRDGLFVAGALAELEIGPVARNIAGARKAAERIAAI